MTKHKFYIITGWPRGGETSLRESLELKGQNYIPETARQIIKERLSEGLTPRPDRKTFAQEIFDQGRINFVTNSRLSSLLLFDRSVIDNADLIFKSDSVGYNKIKGTHLKNRYNNKVFIAPPWIEIYRNDNERDQTYEEAVEVYEWIDKWYRQHDYDVVTLPKDTIKNSVKFILSHMAR
jgi:predicted ATPase